VLPIFCQKIVVFSRYSVMFVWLAVDDQKFEIIQWLLSRPDVDLIISGTSISLKRRFSHSVIRLETKV
jgi:hypothetical protein